MALKMDVGKYSNPFLTLSERALRVKKAMGKNRGRKVTSAIPKMRYNVSSFIPYFSPPPSPSPIEGEGISFVSMAIPIPEARRAVRMICQFPGNAHLKKSENIPAATMI